MTSIDDEPVLLFAAGLQRSQHLAEAARELADLVGPSDRDIDREVAGISNGRGDICEAA